MLFERSGPDDGQRAGRLVEEGSRLATSIGMQSMISQLMGLNSSVSQSHQSTSTVHRLTGRQTEVLSLVAQGKTNAEIAIALNITINTVARHVADIYDRVPATNRVELAAYSHEIGIA
jgi:DNA-binding NarL/FixJ family response regulator